MKKNTHPKYQKVLFIDSATEKFEGKEYPVCYLPTSSSSHPFFTGSSQLVDAEGRVEKFKNRYANAQQKQAAKQPQPKK